jgi:hypoxanthine phosphoribosyltransferase
MESVRLLISSEEIEIAVRRIASEIDRDYQGKEFAIYGILNGAFLFLADLCRKIQTPHSLDFMGASSYGMGKQSTGVLNITKYPDLSPKGKNVLLVEDILETGLTLDVLKKYCLEEGAKEVKICALIQKLKPEDSLGLSLDYWGFSLGDEFIVGYGMDYAGKYRHLPYIGILHSRSEAN